MLKVDIMEKKDRRYSPRIKRSIQAKVDFQSSDSNPMTCLLGEITALNSRGFTLLLNYSNQLPRLIYVEALLPDFNATLKAACIVQWQKKAKINNRLECGVQISEIGEGYLSILHKFLSKIEPDKKYLQDRRISRSVQSIPFEVLNSKGMKLLGILDSPIKAHHSKNDLVVIIPPAYGETKIDSIGLSYLLAANGFTVARYDATKHVGESEGEILSCTLHSLEMDLAAVVDYLQNKIISAKFALIAYGLAARIALRKASEDNRISLLICVAPLFDLSYAFNATYKEDILNMDFGSELPGVIDIFGFPVNAGPFINDIKEHSYQNPERTKDEISKLRLAINLIFGENGNFVSLESNQEIISKYSLPKERVITFPSELNPLGGFARVSNEVLELIVQKLKSFYKLGGDIQQADFKSHLREIVAQQSLEKERMRSMSILQERETKIEFWGRYLEQFQFIIRVPEYRSFYETITEMLGTIKSGDRILDSGCGNGSFGVWLLAQNQWKEPNQGFTYVGLDIVPKALDYAMNGHSEMLWKLKQQGINPGVSLLYNVGDMTKKLPYLDNYFDHICSNLVLSYLPDPLSALKELFRVLKPGSRMVITSIKPNPDFSEIYRKTLEYCKTPEEANASKRLLNNVAGIIEKERQGIFRFLDQEDLLSVIEKLNCKKYELVPSFGGQAYILMISKTL